MQKHKKIKALFFLGIFSMLLLHQVVPHWHHQHQEEHHHDVAHSHHNHHHHKTPEKESSKNDFLDWLVETHTHYDTSTCVLVLHKTSVKKITIENDLVIKGLSLNAIQLFTYQSSALSKKWFKPPDKLQSSYLLNLPLRGPPTLV